MYVGFIGAGGIGQALAKQFLRAGCTVTLSNSRGPGSLASVVRSLGKGAVAGTVEEAARGEIVAIATPWKHLREALQGLPPWNGRIVVDATNPLGPPDFKVADLGGRTSSEVVADLVPGARLVKACNTLPPAVLGADPRVDAGRRVLFMSGDDASAKGVLGGWLEKAGFAVIDLGGLVSGGRLQQFPGGPLPTHNLVKMP